MPAGRRFLSSHDAYKIALLFFRLLLREQEIQENRADRRDDNRRFSEDHRHRERKLVQASGSLRDADSERHREAHDRGASRRERLRGDELHPRHCDRGENGDRRPAEDTLRNRRENCGELRAKPGQKDQSRTGREDLPIYDLVIRHNADILRVGRRGKSSEKGGKEVCHAIGDDPALKLSVRRFPVKASYGCGGEIADRLDGIDRKEKADRDAGRRIKAHAKGKEVRESEPGRLSDLREVHHPKAERREIAGQHSEKDGCKLKNPLPEVI